MDSQEPEREGGVAPESATLLTHGTGNDASEGVKQAGVALRSVAYLLDLLVLWLVLATWGSIFRQSLMPGQRTAPFDPLVITATLVAPSVLSAMYFVLGWRRFGATPGQLITGVAVIGRTTGRLSWGAAFIRWLALSLGGVCTWGMTLGGRATNPELFDLSSTAFGAWAAWSLLLLAMTALSASRRGLHDHVSGSVALRARRVDATRARALALELAERQRSASGVPTDTPEQSNTRAYVTWGIVVITMAVFAVDVGMGYAEGNILLGGAGPLAEAGLIYGPLVSYGEWWRMITSAFIHFGLLHIAFNMYLLWLFGPVLEELYGHVEFAAIYLLCALGGSVLTLMLDPTSAAAGASGAIFGLFGVAFVVARRRHLRLGTQARAVLSQVGGLLVLNLILTFTVPGISWTGHLGGLAVGIALGVVLAPSHVPTATGLLRVPDEGPVASQRPRGLRFATYGATLAVLLGMAAVLSRVQGTLPPPGQVWFGDSADSETLEMEGHTSTLRIDDPFVIVMHLTEATADAHLSVQIYYAGRLANSTHLITITEGLGASELWSMTNTAGLPAAGVWTVKVVDNRTSEVLASGTVTVEP